MRNNTSRVAFSALVLAGVISTTLLQTVRANAEDIQWKAVPGTTTPSVTNPESQPAYIGTNTPIRRGENIVFDANIDGQYVLYAGDCGTKMLYRLSIGTLDRKRQPRNMKSGLKQMSFKGRFSNPRVCSNICW